MSKKKLLPILLLLMIFVDWLVFRFAPENLNDLKLEVTVNSDEAGNFQIYYSDSGDFWTDKVATAAYNLPGEDKKLIFNLGNSAYRYYRMDFGDSDADISISAMKLVCGSKEETVSLSSILNSTDRHSISELRMDGEKVFLEVEGNDPRCILQMEHFDQAAIRNFIEDASWSKTFLMHLLVCIAFDIIFVGIFLAGHHLKTLIKELIQNRKLILKLAVNDFKTKYVGSYLGIIWAFIQPVVTVVVYWFVFSVGLRVVPTGNVPFVLYLVSGLVPWSFFSDSLSGGTSALIEYQYLVKKIVFKISMLPVVKLLSAMFVHLFFIAVALFIAVLSGYLPGLYTLQLFYYIFCNFVLSLALVFITCSIVAFFRDITQIKYEETNDIGALSKFTKTQVQVADARGGSNGLMNYKVYSYGMAVPAPAAMTFTVTI